MFCYLNDSSGEQREGVVLGEGDHEGGGEGEDEEDVRDHKVQHAHRHRSKQKGFTCRFINMVQYASSLNYITKPIINFIMRT